MKLKLLKGIVYNACDRVRGVPFQVDYLQNVDFPEVGSWIIDLKNGESRDQNGDKIELPFAREFNKWFLGEIKKANIENKDIDKAELIFKFNFKNNKPILCSCNIQSQGRNYSNEVVVYLFGH